LDISVCWEGQSGDKTEHEMGGACSAYEEGKRCVRGFGGGNLRESNHWGDPGTDGMIILRWISWKWDVGVWTDWIELDQDRERWRALVNAAMNLRVP
jgi:hypothetical protein